MDVWDINRIADKLEQLDIAIDREAMSMAKWIWHEIFSFQSTREQKLPQHSVDKLQTVFDRLRNEEPVQYIAGHAWFYSLKFKVNQNVLIPRPETEELVEWILSDVKSVPGRQVRILDIGTGSGCIAIVLKKYLKERAEISAMDNSIGALKVAAENGKFLETEITFVQRDFLKDGFVGLGQYDIIVSNPPYISKEAAGDHLVHKLKYEPKEALFPIGEDPDIFYKKISAEAGRALKPGGACYVELNEFRAEQIENCFSTQSWIKQEMRIDMQGLPRMFKAVKGI